MRNGGRRGAKHAPACLLHHFSTLNADKSTNTFRKVEVAHKTLSFEKNQELQKETISQNLNKCTFHFGGGHDHVYPFASSLIEKHGHINIINIDAHLDTRQDPVHHSGTPFRQLHEKYPNQFELHQVGIQEVANTAENYEDLKMTILSTDEVKSEFKFEKNSPLLLSIDCDGLDGSYMSAVSAHNPRGLTQQQFESICTFTKDYWAKEGNTYCGFYELNPLFDNLAASSAKYIAHTIHNLIN